MAAVKTIGTQTIRTLVTMAIFGAIMGVYLEAAGQKRSGCYLGKDHFGSSAKVFVTVERYGDWFEVAGQIRSTGAGRIYRFKADGHSGAGRLYTQHEFESGAVYINVLDLTETTFVLQVESYGVFHFQRARC